MKPDRHIHWIMWSAVAGMLVGAGIFGIVMLVVEWTDWLYLVGQVICLLGVYIGAWLGSEVYLRRLRGGKQ
jgi:hypothetical protein